MNQQVYRFFTEGQHKAYRKELDWKLAEAYAAENLPYEERVTDRFERICKAQTPVIIDGEQICYFRTTGKSPAYVTEQEQKILEQENFCATHLNNITSNYYGVIAEGLLKKRETADAYGKRTIDAIIGLADRYQQEAQRLGRSDIVEVLTQVPRYAARNFREALQFFRILHFSAWLEGVGHNTVGRFDKNMYPYLEKDMAAGIYTRESALELVEDFFLSFAKDYDLYHGVQQGDNGQSLMLGGIDEEGNDVFNLLSELCLEASYNNKLIDPKINLRVSKKTPLEQFIKATELTKAGLGFPQYSNDDIVIPALVELGYDYADAVNYSVAACWEFIVPNVAMDIVNIDSLSYPKAINAAMRQHLTASESFDEFFDHAKDAIHEEVDAICAKITNVFFFPSPLLKVLNGFDVRTDAKYNNFGIHGTGIATAADSLAAIKKYVFEEKTVSKQRLMDAVDSDFVNDPELLHLLRYEAPKLGNNDDYVDSISVELMDTFAAALKGKKNYRGGIYRAGTGSAMNYLRQSFAVGATPDGKRADEPFGANFAISLFAKVKGPVSVVASMAKHHFANAINGGPLTLEFHKSVFGGDDGVEKVARLVRSFIHRGGHQLQLNTVDAEKMRAAQKEPEKYKNLIVRVWGWSAYFVELDKGYQDHVIARQEYTL